MNTTTKRGLIAALTAAAIAAGTFIAATPATAIVGVALDGVACPGGVTKDVALVIGEKRFTPFVQNGQLRCLVTPAPMVCPANTMRSYLNGQVVCIGRAVEKATEVVAPPATTTPTPEPVVEAPVVEAPVVQQPATPTPATPTTPVVETPASQPEVGTPTGTVTQAPAKPAIPAEQQAVINRFLASTPGTFVYDESVHYGCSTAQYGNVSVNSVVALNAKHAKWIGTETIAAEGYTYVIKVDAKTAAGAYPFKWMMCKSR